MPWWDVLKVLLDKGANRLARNKKGRKPGDVFSPTVEDDKKERIKNMLGMGTQEAAAPATAAAPVAAAATAASATAPAATAAEANRGAAGAAGGNGVLSGGSKYSGDVSASTLAASAVPPPAYKVGKNQRYIDALDQCELAAAAGGLTTDSVGRRGRARVDTDEHT